MTDPDTAPADPPPSKTHAEAAVRRSKAMGTALLGALLSALLLLGVGLYLWFAPDPGRLRPEAAPAATAPVRPGNVIALIAPRNIIDAELLRDFEAETGLVVELASYDNEESLLSVASRAGLNADVLLASATTIQRLARDARLAVLPVRAIPNLSRVDPVLRTLARRYDAGGLSAAPYAWTTLGLAVNRALAATLPQDPDTWSTLFDPARVQGFAACGVQSPDAPSLAFPAALLSLGLSPFSDTPGDIERASAAWESIRDKIAGFDTRGLVDALAGGKACLALALAGDTFRARALARDAGQTPGPEFLLPREGAVLRLYMLALPRAAQVHARAPALVDYLLRPEVSARMTNTKWLANAVPAAQLYVRQDIKDDPLLYPGVDAFARLTPETNPPDAVISLRERFWQLMSAGAKSP